MTTWCQVVSISACICIYLPLTSVAVWIWSRSASHNLLIFLVASSCNVAQLDPTMVFHESDMVRFAETFLRCTLYDLHEPLKWSSCTNCRIECFCGWLASSTYLAGTVSVGRPRHKLALVPRFSERQLKMVVGLVWGWSSAKRDRWMWCMLWLDAYRVLRGKNSVSVCWLE